MQIDQTNWRIEDYLSKIFFKIGKISNWTKYRFEDDVFLCKHMIDLINHSIIYQFGAGKIPQLVD